MSAHTDFTKRQTKEKVLRLLGLQKLHGLSESLQSKSKSFFISQLKNMIIDESKQKREELVESEKIKSEKYGEIARQNQVLKELTLKNGLINFRSWLSKHNKEQKCQVLLQLKTHHKKINGLIKMKSFIYRYDQTHNLQKYFSKWGLVAKSNLESQHKHQIIQTVIERMFCGNKSRACFKRWKQQTQNLYLSDQKLIFIISKKQQFQKKSQMTLRVAYQTWRSQVGKYNKLKRVLEHTQYPLKRQSFQTLKQYSKEQKAHNKNKLLFLTITKCSMAQYKSLMQAFQMFVRNNNHCQFESPNATPKSLMLATFMFKFFERQEQQSLKAYFHSWKGSFLLHSNANKECKLNNFMSLMQEIQQSRYRQFFSNLVQLFHIRKHQQKVISKLIQKCNSKSTHYHFKRWNNNAQLQTRVHQANQQSKLQAVILMRNIERKQAQKLLSHAYLQWFKFSEYENTSIKVSIGIKKMIATTKIQSIYNQVGVLRQSFVLWVKATQNYENVHLGLQMLSQFQKKKLKAYFNVVNNQVIRQSQDEKSQKIRGSVLYYLMSNLAQKSMARGFNKLVTQSYTKKMEGEKKKLKQKKNEIHNQIVYLTERDKKVSQQEAQLSMKEKCILEKEKELKSKQKRLAEISKMDRERKKSCSKSPSRYAINMPQSTTNRTNTATKFINMNTQMEQSISGKQSITQSQKIPSIRMDIISSIQSDVDLVTHKINQVSQPFGKQYTKEIKSSTQFYTAQSISSSSSSMIGKENNTSSGPHGSVKNLGYRKSSYLSSTNQNVYGSMVSSSSNGGQLSSRNANGTSKCVENMKMKLYKSALTQFSDTFRNISLDRSISKGFRALKLNMQQQNHTQGAAMIRDHINKKILSECLIQWLKSIYEDEILMQESLEIQRMVKLRRALIIVDRYKRNDEVQMVRAFKEWKRMGLQSILQGLQQYSDTVNINKARSFPAKRRFLNNN